MQLEGDFILYKWVKWSTDGLSKHQISDFLKRKLIFEYSNK